MHKARIYLPDGISEKVLTRVKHRAADEYGGYTVLQGRGGWVDDSGNLVEENVSLLEVTGAGKQFARPTARYVARNSDETAVMWEVLQLDGSELERGEIAADSDILGQIEKEVTEITGD